MAGDVREALAERDKLLLEQHLEETASRADYLSGARRAFAACALAALAGSGVVLRQCRTVGVVLHIQGVGQIPVEDLAERDVPQGQIAGVQHRTGVDLHRSRHAHTYGTYLLRRQAAPLRQALGQRHQCLHQCFLVGDLGNFALFHSEDAALVVHQPRLQVGAADVNADVVHFCSSLCRVRASIWRSTRSTKSLAGL